MSAKTRIIKPLWPWLEKLVAWGSDRSNPMLVRCVRQELRSKAFIAGYILALAVAMVAALIVAKISSDYIARDRETALGYHLFLWLSLVWSFILVPMQAGLAFRTITTERHQDTWDLVELTGMRPGLILRGLLLTTIAQALLYTTALAPYMMLAYLLRGIDFMQIAAAMTMVIGCSLFTASIGALGGALVQGKQARGFLGFCVVAGAFLLWLGLREVIWNELNRDVAQILSELARFDLETWLGILAMFNGWAVAIIFCLVLAATQLTHRAGDRSSPARTMIFIIVINMLAWFTCLPWIDRYFDAGDLFGTYAIVLSLSAAVLGFFSTTEDHALSPRQAQVIKQAKGFWGLRMVVCGPGACRGHRAYLSLAIPAMICAFIALYLECHIKTCYFALAVVAYTGLIYGGCDLLFRSKIIPGIQTPLHRRSLTFASIMALSLIPMLLAWLISGDDIEDNPLVFLSPFFGSVMIVDGARHDSGLARLVGVGFIGGLFMCRCAFMALQGDIRLRRIRARNDDRNPRNG